MKSELPKVLQEVDGKPMIYHILNQVRKAAPGAPVAVVVGVKKELVEAYIKNEPVLQGMNISFVFQEKQSGTGHATRIAMDSDWGKARIAEGASVLILPGDLPLVPEKLVADVTRPLAEGVALRLLTCALDQPKGYGRIVRQEPSKEVLKIVEEKDANAEQKKIKEVGLSTYLFDSRFLSESLRLLTTNNAQGEFYLTDLIEIAHKQNRKVDVLTWPDQDDVRNVNNPEELLEADKIMKKRKASPL
jgi:bifunctional N-acetylglucosamine-1-phosphate-uridyltransferase/glucosamine-1-phosphate-acetyltransferase GlmU-like protein